MTVVLHNFPDEPVELTCDGRYGPPERTITLHPYGYRWLRGMRVQPT